MAGFVLPPLLRLRRVPTLRVLRREWQGAEPGFFAAYGFGALLLAALMLWMAGETKLGAIVFAGFASALVALWWCRVSAVARAAVRGAAHWRLGLANLRRHWRATVMQAVALGLGLTTLLLLTVARNDLLASWRSKRAGRCAQSLRHQPAGGSADGLRRFRHRPRPAGAADGADGARPPDGRERCQPWRPRDYADDRARRLVEREFNLSWTSETARRQHASRQDNGMATSREPQFSVEQGLAETLGLKLGDELTYEVGGVPLSARITSLRKLDWDSMRVNFFVIAPPGMLEDNPVSYVTSFHLPAGKASAGHRSGADLSEPHRDRRHQHGAPVAGQLRPGCACRAGAVRPSPWPPGWWCC